MIRNATETNVNVKPLNDILKSSYDNLPPNMKDKLFFNNSKNKFKKFLIHIVENEISIKNFSYSDTGEYIILSYDHNGLSYTIEHHNCIKEEDINRQEMTILRIEEQGKLIFSTFGTTNEVMKAIKKPIQYSAF